MTGLLFHLPNELLLHIFTFLDDLGDFVSTASVCKRFHELVKLTVLISGDGPTQTGFKTIASNYVQLSYLEEFSHYKQVFRKYHHIVFEYSLFHKVRIERYLSVISRVKASRFVGVTEVFLNEKAAHYSFGVDNINNVIFKNHRYMYDATRTIYLYGSDQALLIKQGVNEKGEDVHDSMTIVSRTYNFTSIKQLPYLQVSIDPMRRLKIVAPKLEKIAGIVNYHQLTQHCRAYNSSEFFKRCYTPHIKHLEGLLLTKGFDYKVLERFPNLETISFSIIATDEEPPTHEVLLPKLKSLELSGDSICLINLKFPVLKKIYLRSFAMGNNGDISDLSVKNVDTPLLDEIHIKILGDCRKTFGQALEGFRSLESITRLEMSGNVKVSDFREKHVFPKLTTCILKGVVDVRNRFFENVLYNRTQKIEQDIQRNIIKAVSPRLGHFVTDDLYDIQHLALTGITDLRASTYLRFSLDLQDPYLRKGYVLQQEHFPSLETLEITLNKYLDLKRKDIAEVLKSFIRIDLGNVKLEKLVILKPLLDLNCIKWLPDYVPQEIIIL